MCQTSNSPVHVYTCCSYKCLQVSIQPFDAVTNNMPGHDVMRIGFSQLAVVSTWSWWRLVPWQTNTVIILHYQRRLWKILKQAQNVLDTLFDQCDMPKFRKHVNINVATLHWRLHKNISWFRIDFIWNNPFKLLVGCLWGHWHAAEFIWGQSHASLMISVWCKNLKI